MTITSPEPVLVIEVEVDAPTNIGAVGMGARRFIPITGGRISGFVEGEILAGGADWQTVRDDGNLEIEAHYAFRAADDAIVEVQSIGVRAGAPEVLDRLAAGAAVDPSEYYFRTLIRFRSGAPQLAHLNVWLGLARGRRDVRGVRLEVFQVL